MHRTHLNIVATLETTISRMPANVEAERSILGAILTYDLRSNMGGRSRFPTTSTGSPTSSHHVHRVIGVSLLRARSSVSHSSEHNHQS
jgi:hypothetical protein